MERVCQPVASIGEHATPNHAVVQAILCRDVELMMKRTAITVIVDLMIVSVLGPNRFQVAD